jgi:bifunctional DNA-binding transcriptional regulator/antitoxin component of YhaV-PrlF toxin-antitoxin module
VAKTVKRSAAPARDRTRVSSKHQVTIKEPAFTAAGLRPGDALQVRAVGPGQVVLTRVDELLERYRGALPPGTFPAGWLERERSEWE